MSTGIVLIIDDEEKLRALLARIIRLEGMTVLEAETLKAGGRLLDKEDIDVVLCDVKLPDGNGVDFVKEMKAKHPTVETILLTAYGNIADGVAAMKNGAFDYITKGDDNDKIIPLLARALEKVQLQKRVVQLEQEVGKNIRLRVYWAVLLSSRQPSTWPGEWRPQKLPSCCWARRAPARKSSPRPSITAAKERTNRSWR
jgi:DNA-binding NtrC family response regulator